jgi:hypothetical protein
VQCLRAVLRVDSPANIFFIALLMQAASRRMTNSKPSLEMRVTYLLEPCFWLELAMTDDLGEWVDVERARFVETRTTGSQARSTFLRKHVMPLSMTEQSYWDIPIKSTNCFLIIFWLHSNHRRLVSQMTAKSSNWSSMLIVLTTCALHQSNTLDLWIEPMLSRFRWPPAEASSFNHSKDRPWSNCPRASADLLKERLRSSTPLACGVSMLKDHPQTESWWSSSY